MADSSIQVLIQADASGLESGAKQASDSADQISEKLQGIKDAASVGAEGLDEAAKSVGALSGALGSLATIAGGVFGGLELESIAGKLKGAFEDATFGAFSWGESLTNLGIQTGMSVEQLQILERAALISGKSLDSVTGIVNRLSRTMLEFASGKVSPKMQSAVEVLGFNPADFTDAYSMLDGLSTRIAEIGPLTLAQRGAIEEMFGRSVLSALPWIEKLHEVGDSMRANNEILGNDTVAANDKAAQAIHKLGAEWASFEHEFGGAAASAILDFLDSMAKGVKNVNDEINKGLGTKDWIATVTSYLGFSTPEMGGGTGGAMRTKLDAEQEQPAQTQPATDAQQQLTAAVQGTGTATESLKDIQKDWADNAKSTLDQIIPKVIAYDQAWHDTYHVDPEMGAALLAARGVSGRR